MSIILLSLLFYINTNNLPSIKISEIHQRISNILYYCDKNCARDAVFGTCVEIVLQEAIFSKFKLY